MEKNYYKGHNVMGGQYRWAAFFLLTMSCLCLYGSHGAFCSCGACMEARNAGFQEGQSSVSPPAFSVTIIEERRPPPRYQLGKGIDIAIENVRKADAVVTTRRVFEELDRMAAVNDIQLPYSYNSSTKTRHSISGKIKGLKTRKWLNPEQTRKKVAFEKWVEWKVDMVARGNAASCEAPVPSDYTKREEFVKAYVDYKMSTVDNEIIEQYSSKIDGLDGYRREMKSVASRIWQHSK